jgi:signal peptidase II
MKFKNNFFWIAAIFSLLIDRLTKYLIVENMSYLQSIPLWKGVFHFTYVLNEGAAFSLFKGAIWLRWLSLAVSLALILWAVLGPVFEQWEKLGYGFILGGAIGNGIDRFINGKVVDFLHFKLIDFPVFNFADVFINLGLACLLFTYLKKESTQTKPK